MSTSKAVQQLEKIVQDNAGKTGKLRFTLTLDELRDLNARITMLTDSVVGAAALHFGEIKDSSEASYASEELHLTASDLVREFPRLAGGYKGGQ